MAFEVFYPGFIKKAITFTMDDGNLTYDKKFIDIVKPEGIKGAFNLNGAERLENLTVREYKEFYSGFEIANHCKRHPKVILPTDNYVISEDKFDMKTSNPDFIYRSDIEGLYYKYFTSYWGFVATPETYIKLIDECQRELCEIFDVKCVPAFVWPYHNQDCDALHKHLLSAGYTSVRRTGSVGFELPENRMDWSYNAVHKDIMERALEFEGIEDDGILRFFCFGVHTIDFERGNCWDSLERFAKQFGKRNDEFWYSTPTEIFDYADATKLVLENAGVVKNNSTKTVYIKINGKKAVLLPNEEAKI